MREKIMLLILLVSMMAASAWPQGFYPVRRVRAPLRHLVPPPRPTLEQGIPVIYSEPSPVTEDDNEKAQRPKRNHDDDYDHDYDKHSHGNHHDHGDHLDHGDDKGTAGPVHTFVKTDKNANYKWGVRHHVGNKYAS